MHQVTVITQNVCGSHKELLAVACVYAGQVMQVSISQ